MPSDSLLEDRSVFWQSFEDFSSAIEKKKNSSKPSLEVLGQARALAQTYFRLVKPELDKLGISQDLQESSSSLSDLRDYKRISFRGTASELRECVREVLDHLAPDGDVTASPAFKLEAAQTKPTMKQKARFILKARKVAEGGRQVPEDMIGLVEDSVASLPRALYTQGSLATHISHTRAQVAQLKVYTDAILAEMLQLAL